MSWKHACSSAASVTVRAVRGVRGVRSANWTATCALTGALTCALTCTMLLACSAGTGGSSSLPPSEGSDRTFGGGTDPGRGSDTPTSAGRDPVFGGTGSAAGPAPRPCTSTGNECGPDAYCTAKKGRTGFCIDSCDNGAVCRAGQLCIDAGELGLCAIPCTSSSTCPQVAGLIAACVHVSSADPRTVCTYVEVGSVGDAGTK